MKNLLLFLTLLALPSFLFSQWSTDPSVNNAVCNNSSGQSDIVSCADGAGGIIVAWRENFTIKAQRMNAFGQRVWPASGILISADTGMHRLPKMIPDGAGGAIITWMKGNPVSNHDVYAQRIRPDGVIMWTDGGIKVNSGIYQTDFYSLKIVEAGAGSAIIAWIAYGSNSFVLAQKIDAFGSRVWNSNDLQISSVNAFTLEICKDARNGAYFVYTDYSRFYGQHVNAAGDTTWNTSHIIVPSGVYLGYAHLCEDQNYGFFMAWESYNGTLKIKANHIDSNGSTLWGANGIDVTPPGHQTLVSCISDLHGGAYVTWLGADNVTPQFGYAVMAQNIDYNGQLRWNANGVMLGHNADYFATPSFRMMPEFATVDALGGLIACWIAYENALYNTVILAQKADYYGNLQWDTNGVYVSSGYGKSDLSGVSDGGSGGFNAVWVDFLRSPSGIYAQHVKANSQLGNRGGSGTSGIPTTSKVEQNYPNPFNPVTNIIFELTEDSFVSLKIYDMTGREVATLANKFYNTGQYSVQWNASNFASGVYFYRFNSGGKTEVKSMMLIK